MSAILANINEAEFGSEVLERPGLVLVDFWASWCGPCRMLAPTLEQIQQELGGKIKIVKVNVEENQALAFKYNVQNIPYVLVLKDGEVVDHILGNRPKSDLMKTINKHL